MNPSEDMCLLSTHDTEQKILLLGNSHADSIKTSFLRSANHKDFSVYFAVENDPLIGGKLNPEDIVRKCNDLNISYLAIHYSNVFDNPQHREAIGSLIELSIENKISPLLIAPVPGSSEHVPKALLQNLDSTPAFAIDRAAHMEKIAAFHDFTSTLEGLDVAVYDPSKIFCAEEADCRVFEGAFIPYYYDATHLTLTGAALLEPMFEQIFKDILSE